MNIYGLKMAAIAAVTGSKSRQKERRMMSTLSVLFNNKVKDFPETSPRDFFLHTINQNRIMWPFIM